MSKKCFPGVFLLYKLIYQRNTNTNDIFLFQCFLMLAEYIAQETKLAQLNDNLVK